MYSMTRRQYHAAIARPLAATGPKTRPKPSGRELSTFLLLRNDTILDTAKAFTKSEARAKFKSTMPSQTGLDGLRVLEKGERIRELQRLAEKA